MAAVAHEVANKYRNPAAHIAVLDADDYGNCHEVVVGANGALWSLLAATDKV
jgi:hypothetical protein